MHKVSNESDIQDEVDKDLLTLSQFGVCRSDNAGTLLELGYLTGSSKWFKPIVGAINYYCFTAQGQERALAVEIDALNATDASSKRVDPFSQVDWAEDNYNSLIFTPERIMAEIVKGNSEQISKSSTGQTWMNAKLGRESGELTSEGDAPSHGAYDD